MITNSVLRDEVNKINGMSVGIKKIQACEELITIINEMSDSRFMKAKSKIEKLKNLTNIDLKLNILNNSVNEIKTIGKSNNWNYLDVILEEFFNKRNDSLQNNFLQLALEANLEGLTFDEFYSGCRQAVDFLMAYIRKQFLEINNELSKINIDTIHLKNLIELENLTNKLKKNKIEDFEIAISDITNKKFNKKRISFSDSLFIKSELNKSIKNTTFTPIDKNTIKYSQMLYQSTKYATHTQNFIKEITTLDIRISQFDKYGLKTEIIPYDYKHIEGINNKFNSLDLSHYDESKGNNLNFLKKNALVELVSKSSEVKASHLILFKKTLLKIQKFQVLYFQMIENQNEYKKNFYTSIKSSLKCIIDFTPSNCPVNFRFEFFNELKIAISLIETVLKEMIFELEIFSPDKPLKPSVLKLQTNNNISLHDIINLMNDFLIFIEPTSKYESNYSTHDFKRELSIKFENLIAEIELFLSLNTIHLRNYANYIIKKISIPEPQHGYVSSNEASTILKEYRISINVFFSNISNDKNRVHFFQNLISYNHSSLTNHLIIKPANVKDALLIHKSFISYLSEHFINELITFIKSLYQCSSPQKKQVVNLPDSKIIKNAVNEDLLNDNSNFDSDDEINTESENNTENLYSFKLFEPNKKKSNIINMFEKLETSGFLSINSKKDFIALFREGKTNCIIQWEDEDISNIYNFINHLSKLNRSNSEIFQKYPKHIWSFSSKIFKTKKGDFISPNKRYSKPTIKDHILKSAVDFLK